MTVTPDTLAPYAAKVYEALGPLTAHDPENGYPAAWLVGGMMIPLEDIYAVARDPRILFDPARCPASLLGWLAQFVGIVPARYTEAQLRAAIPAPERWIRGTTDAVEIAAARTLAPGARVTILVNADPATHPADAAGHWTIITSVADTPEPSSLQAACKAAAPSFVKLHFVLGAGGTWDSASGTWDAQTTTWAEA